MRFLLAVSLLVFGCAKPEPVQDPLDYLRVGVDPRQEADAIIADLRRNGFTIGRRIDGANYVAFDALRGPDSTVRVITTRGASVSIRTPDVRRPERLWVELGTEPRPDFDRDGNADVVISMRERGRTCLAWAQVDADGFVSEVFRPLPDWGDLPCVVQIDPNWPRLLLELNVPLSPAPDARVRVPVRASARNWVLDDSPSALVHWEREVEQRKNALEDAEVRGDADAAERLKAELDWLGHLRKATEPVLEPASDGKEPR